MTHKMSCRDRCLLLFVLLLVLIADSHAGAEDKYPFVAQQAGNSLECFRCLGLTIGIERLEEGAETEGVESSEELASRLLSEFNDRNDVGADFAYYSDLRLRNGKRVPTCSKAAIEEVGSLIQEAYVEFLEVKLWQVEVDPDSGTPEGRALLKIRQKYLNLDNNLQEYSVTSEAELKALFNNEEDRDGLVALCGHGHRFFERGTPQRVIDHSGVHIDPKTGKHPRWIPSAHAFLLTYNKNEDQFYVYDSDDSDGEWPVTVEGAGRSFSIRWRIDDHIGNGPSRQVYCDVKLLGKFLADMSDVVKSNHGR